MQRNNFSSPLIWVLNWNSAAAFCQAWKQKLISMTQASGGELCQVISLRLCYSGSITVLIHTQTQAFPESLVICGAFNCLLLGFTKSRGICRKTDEGSLSCVPSFYLSRAGRMNMADLYVLFLFDRVCCWLSRAWGGREMEGGVPPPTAFWLASLLMKEAPILIALTLQVQQLKGMSFQASN